VLGSCLSHLVLVIALPEEEQLAGQGVVEQQLLDAASLIDLWRNQGNNQAGK